MYKCKYCNKEFKKSQQLGGHINNCNMNPLKEKINKKKKKKLSILGKKRTISDETRKKISESMKKAHSEGRAWNIGKSRWNNKPSYPEKFFIKVIENEFKDKDYTREFNIGIYSLDFAWINKKLCIEIDGSQHERFKEIKERDIKKDKLLKNKGWKILRIKWKDLYHNTKEWIKVSKDFVENNPKILNIPKEYMNKDYLKEEKERNKITEKEKIIKEKKEIIKIIKINILKSDINFYKFGWVGKASKIIGITSQKVNQWMKRNMLEFYEEKCFKRNVFNENNNINNMDR